MLVLFLKTDQPRTDLALYAGPECIAADASEAGRQLAETIQLRIDALLAEAGKQLSDLQGLVVYQGPGSFTGLRIGMSVANALAYGLQIPIAGGGGENWQRDGIRQLTDRPTMTPIVPNYGAPVHITAPRK